VSQCCLEASARRHVEDKYTTCNDKPYFVLAEVRVFVVLCLGLDRTFLAIMYKYEELVEGQDWISTSRRRRFRMDKDGRRYRKKKAKPLLLRIT
jgi:hypothetical protein